MSISNEQLSRAVNAAKAREAKGYFGRVKAGDQKAASLFARLVAGDLNPSGNGNDYGWLSKSPGESQVDGWAEDAIVFGNDPDDRENVVDLVNGAGAPGASIGGGVKPRRENNKWVKPQALTAVEMAYLLEGFEPAPPPSTTLPKGEAFAKLKELNAFYAAPEGLQRKGGLILGDGSADMEAIAQWFYQIVIEGHSIEDVKAQIRQSDEWKSKHPTT